MYQDLILQHYRAPHGRGLPANATAQGARKTPMCGDDLQVAIVVDGGRITEVGFDGRGCSISTASASMLTDAVRGVSLLEARTLIDRVEGMLRGEAGEPPPVGDLLALSGVAAFPQRVGCARLPWQALRDALQALPV